MLPVSLHRCGNFVAAGERGGSAPEVLIFDLSSGRCISALAKGHKHGIGAIAFSSDGEAPLGLNCCPLLGSTRHLGLNCCPLLGSTQHLGLNPAK